jgi:hypothetical protein
MRGPHYEQIFEFLGYDFLYVLNIIFCTKTNSKEVKMSRFSESQSEKYWSQEVASNKLEKGPLMDHETGFS